MILAETVPIAILLLQLKVCIAKLKCFMLTVGDRKPTTLTTYVIDPRNNSKLIVHEYQ